MVMYDRSRVRLRLKVLTLKAEVVETLLFGCIAWTPSKAHYSKMRQVYYSLLLRCFD